MLKIENLSFSYQNRLLLKDISLTLETGNAIALLGPSGSGKTTLFRLITGLLAPDRGVITINGLEPRFGLESLSYMMQEDLLLPWRTALENVLLPAEFLKMTMKKEALALLDEVGLKGFESCYPHQLSGGMKQRVALARALLLDRPLLILDEPFASIDTMRKKELIDLLLTLKKRRGLTLLFITHDLHEARALSDRLYQLDQGTLQEVS